MIKRSFRHSFSLLNVDRVDLNAKWNYKNVISPYCRIYYIDAGEGELSDLTHSLKLEPGYLYIIPSFTLCNFYCNDALSQYFVQFFEDSPDGTSLFVNSRAVARVEATQLDRALFDRLLEINPGRGINRSDDPRIYEKEIFYKEYQQYNDMQTMARYLETQGVIAQLVARFLNPVNIEPKKQAIIPVKMADTLNYILLNLHEELAVKQLAARINQNADHFSRQFKLHTGLRPANFINEKRIERAQYLVATSDLGYAEISKRTGFDTMAYFSRIFKKFTGMSPREYRKYINSGQG